MFCTEVLLIAFHHTAVSNMQDRSLLLIVFLRENYQTYVRITKTSGSFETQFLAL